ncbi:MAG: ComEA family DNA-binding protein [Gemmatimonadota bacterium]|nr:ComEA family DNA-binding protein [Gemmatimonadota bacterium]
MTKGEIQAVIFVAASMLAGAVILLVKQYDADFLPDLGPAPVHGRLNAGIETESATTDVDDSNALLPSTRADSGQPDSGQPDSGQPDAGNLLVPVNTAPASELQKLPGIGPKLAEAIIEYRTRSGPFKRVGELLEVKGIGPAKLGRIRPLVKLK